jgi:hypothetical protein
MRRLALGRWLFLSRISTNVAGGHALTTAGLVVNNSFRSWASRCDGPFRGPAKQGGDGGRVHFRLLAGVGLVVLTGWLSPFGELRAMEMNPQRTLLAKHLDDFTTWVPPIQGTRTVDNPVIPILWCRTGDLEPMIQITCD